MIVKPNYKGKTAVITGATGSIGQAVAKLFAQNKINLILISTNKNKLEAVSEELKVFDISVESYTCDFASLDELKSLIKNQLENKKIEILVNSAGIFPNRSIAKMSLDDYIKVLNINLNASYLLCASLSMKMKRRKWGRIVNIGSSSCYGGFKNTSAYCISKHGLLGLSRSLHDELKDFGVRVYNISPSSTKGKMGRMTKGQDYSTFLEPEEIADYVMFSISHNGNAMSQEILINRMTVR